MENQRTIEKLSEVLELQELPLQYTGITLNNQDIDLMMIANSKNLDDLETSLKKITNIKTTIDSNASIEDERQRIFDLYMDSLTPKIDYLVSKDKGTDIRLPKKIEYLKQSGTLSSEEVIIIDEIISSGGTQQEMIRELISTYSQNPSKLHQIYKTLRDYTPIEKTGVIGTSLEAYRNLYNQIQQNYNSITIDEEAKYGSIVLGDGTFDFDHLKKSLDFAKETGKQVRLNTLIFYQDCPEYLYQLPKNEESKRLVKQKLMDYVSATTKFIAENGYGDVVRSYDVFNELLNRFPLESDTPYQYRGDINQEPTLYRDFDNVKSGWLKHLDISDLCDIIAEARKTLPDTDFMFNDDNLTDSRKIEANKKLISEIQRYEKEHGVKLIDSIGTQMHIDNNVSQTDIENMIRELSKFGLPIEITEFDIAMTRGVEGLSDFEIELLRQQKINEVYSVVEKLKDECNIRGFTIWSKTDRQNFRVSLANEIRIKVGQQPIESLHGGTFTEDMQPKSKVYGKYLLKNKFQSFNYHTHTNRCGHASAAAEREYVARARANGITQLGFSDHVPVPDLDYQDLNHQMHISEVDEYIKSIRHLQAENPDMKIIIGFEAEFDPMKEQFLGELREKVDYMILGQHFVPNGTGLIKQNNNPDYPLQYAELLCQAMESGIFDIIAHPDIFMQHRDSLATEEAKRQFEANAIKASKTICEKAKELGIPIELNFASINKGQIMSDGEYSYPHSTFWKIASETGVQVLYGVDAHDPMQFDAMVCNKEIADQMIDPSKLKFVSPDYNPIKARQENQTLQELYAVGQEKATTYETNLATQLISSLLGKTADTPEMDSMMPVEVDTTMQDEVGQKFDIARKKMEEDAVRRCKNIEEKIEKLSQDKTMSPTEMKFKLEREKQALIHTANTHTNRQEVLNNAKAAFEESIKIGCTSKQDIISTVSKITEAKTTKNEGTREKMQASIERTKQISSEKQLQHDKPKVFVKETNNTSSGNRTSSSNGSSPGNGGFANTLSLIFIITFILGILFSLGYIFYKNIIS